MLEVLLFFAMLALVLAIIGLMVWNYNRVERREAVKQSRKSSIDIMSRSSNEAPQNTPSALETDARQTTDRPMIPVPTAEQMLDIFRVLRAAGIKRETISGPWRAAGLPLNNNTWSKAEPTPQEPQAVTPIAGRPTNAKFHDDPELDYQPLR